MTHNFQLTVEIPPCGPSRPSEFAFSNFFGSKPAVGAPRHSHPDAGSPGAGSARGPEPRTPFPTRPAPRRGCLEKAAEKGSWRGKERGEGEGERGGEGRGRAGGKAQEARRRPPRPLGPWAGLTFQVAAGGRGEPLLGLAAHQLQADLQHFRVPAPRGPAPLLSRGGSGSGSAGRSGSVRRPGPPRPRHGPHRPPRPPQAAAGSLPLRTPLTKGPGPAREARPAS